MHTCRYHHGEGVGGASAIVNTAAILLIATECSKISSLPMSNQIALKMHSPNRNERIVRVNTDLTRGFREFVTY